MSYFDEMADRPIQCPIRFAVRGPAATPRGRATIEYRVSAAFTPNAGLSGLVTLIERVCDGLAEPSKLKLSHHVRIDDLVYMRPTANAKATENG